MGTMTETETINAARKQHRCDWCGECVEVGQPYKRWRWFDGGEAMTVRVHPECKDALDEAAHEEGGTIEFTPFDNPRGCNCGHSRGCDRCEARKAQTHNA